MAIKTVKTTATASKTSSELDLFEGLTASKEAKREAAEIAGEILIEEINKNLNSRQSPIAGGEYKATLSKEYKKIKTARGEPGVANLQLSGSMLDSLDVRVSNSGRLEIGVFGADAKKADGHNNFSGKSKLPLREFLPKDGQDFRSGITKKLNEVVAEAVAASVKLPVRRLKAASTKTEFFDILRESFPGLSNAKITQAIMTQPELVQFLRDRDLLGYL